MRIDAYNTINRVYGTTSKPKVSQSSKTGSTDKVEISQFGKDLQVAKAAVSNAADVREDRIAEVQAKYPDGNYEVSADELAEKLAAKYNTTVF